MTDHAYADVVLNAGETYVAPKRVTVVAMWIDQMTGVGMVRIRDDDGEEQVVRLCLEEAQGCR